MANDQEPRETGSNISSGASSSSSSWSRFPLSSLKLAVEIFDGTGHLGMWQGEVLDSLFKQGLDIATEEKKPDDITDSDWGITNRLACGTIRLCLSREQKNAFKNETHKSIIFEKIDNTTIRWIWRTKMYADLTSKNRETVFKGSHNAIST